ncbi:MAG: hypothetical protein H0Z19_00335 [Archaeoglobus sp.]|uniref:hypothetical protein n=1 Tax=Archaeoglobus sp. TaxID=1872626 RepID=UPI001D4DE658|nr:hypothetical protein [Archaeoglobus sp.]MBO8178923.1 hypothetical protein [Archaeoglobus sp.]
MILLVLAIISATTAFQGDIVNITLDEPAHVTLDDCMYFLETLENSSYLSAGTHSIKITHSCLGSYQIEVKTNRTEYSIPLTVEKDPNPEENVVELESRLLQLSKQIEGLRGEVDYYKKLFEVLNNMNVELYDRIQNYAQENERLKKELEKYKTMASNCTKVVKELEGKVEDLNATLTRLEAENSDLKLQIEDLMSKLSTARTSSETFQTLFFVTLSFLVGSAFALMRR